MKRLLPLVVIFAAASTAIAAPKPKITSPTTSSGTIGVPYSYQITADQAITTWNAAPLPAGLTVNTATGLISGTPTVVGVFSVTLSATNGNGTGTVPLTLTIGNPVPTTSSINPSSCLAGSPQFSLTVNGTNFVATSSVRWNGTALTTTFVSSTQLTATVPAANVATAGTAQVTVVNPAPGGGTSNPQTFTINNPVPTTSSINPTCATAGGAQFTLTVNGTNFVSTSTVKWNGNTLATTFISSTQLTATVTAALIATSGTASITVVNPTPGGGTSNAQTFTIVATPVITSPLTACGAVGAPFSYTITASNNPTSFTASSLPAGLTVNTSTGAISGTPTQARTTNVTITASNGAGPCNTATATLVITIGTTPTISSLSPTCTAAGGPQFTLTVNGNNFVSGTTVNWNGSPLVTTFVSSTRLTAIVPASLIATPGTASVTVGGCGGTSGGATFTISATPTISSISPTCAAAGDPQFTLTVNGINFVSTSIVNWNGAALTTTFVSSTQLTATVPANKITTPGTASITVVSPCGATSNAVTFPIDDTPAITSLLTDTATVGTPFTYQITANNNPTSYDASGLPGGLTVDTTTGLISGTPTATGVFPVTISAINNASDPCSGTATDTLTLTVNFPGGIFIPPYPGQVNVFYWGTTPPPPGAQITFPNASTDNYFVLYWNPPGTTTHPTMADYPTGGLQRNQDLVGMQ